MSLPSLVQGAPATAALSTPAPAASAADPAAAATPTSPVVPAPGEVGKDPEPPKKEDKFSARFAALSRQEKQLAKEKAELKAQREAQEKEWAPKLAQVQRYEELKAKGKTDKTIALEALKELGLSYDDFTKLVLNDNKATPEMIARAAQEQVDAMRQELVAKDEAAKQSQKTDAQKAEQAATNEFKGQILDIIKSDPDAFELTAAHAQGVDLVYSVVEEHYRSTNRVLTPQEAAKAVEAHLEALLEAERDGGKIPKKLQKLFSPKVETPPTPVAAGAAPDPKPVASRTLTNDAQTSVPTPTKTQTKSVEDSKLEASKLLRWT